MEKGDLTIKQEDYSDGFYIVSLLNYNDDACSVKSSREKYYTDNVNVFDRSKLLSVTITVPISDIDMNKWISYTIVYFSILWIAIFLFPSISIFASRFKSSTKPEVSPERTPLIEDNAYNPGLNSRDQRSRAWYCGNVLYRMFSIGDFFQKNFNKLASFIFTRFKPQSYTKIAVMFPPEDDTSKESKRFSLFWYTFAVLLYFLMPAIQMVIFDVTPHFNSTSMDACFHNFECSFPDHKFRSVNNIISSLSFIFIGVLSFGTFGLDYFLRNDSSTTGVAQTTEFSFTLSLTLIALGWSTVCFSICPNEANHHFSTSIQYLIITLIGIQLYTSRHPSTSVGPITTIFLLSFLEILDFSSTLFTDVYFFLVFNACYLVAIGILAVKVLCHGTRSLRYIKRYLWSNMANNTTELRNPFMAGKDVQILVLCGIIFNLGLVVLACIRFNAVAVFDYGRYIITVLVANVYLYIVYYIVMKVSQFIIFCCCYLYERI